jgi:hypothetical protein
MDLNLSQEAASCPATRELTSILWNPKVHYLVRDGPPSTRILNQITLVNTTQSRLSKIYRNITHPPMSCLPNDLWAKCIKFRHFRQCRY